MSISRRFVLALVTALAGLAMALPAVSALAQERVVVFAAAIGALYFWTRGRASDAPAPDDNAVVPEASYR